MDDDQSNSFLHDGDIELIKNNKIIFIFFLHNLEEKNCFATEIEIFIFGQKFSVKSQNLDLI